MTPAETAAALFTSNGVTWQDRPIKPPPYVPTADQIKAVYDELFAKVVDPNIPNNIAGARNLRVRAIRPAPSSEPGPTTYAFEATPDGANYHTIAILNADGTEAS